MWRWKMPQKLPLKRVNITNGQNWLLNATEVECIRRMMIYLKKVDSTPVMPLYAQCITIIKDSYHRNIYCKYLLMYMWKVNLIRIKCNGGAKIIQLNKNKKLT